MLASPQLTITTPTGSALSGGGAVALGGTLALLLDTVPIASGGTGVTVAPKAGQFLRDDGSGGWPLGAITLTDLPPAAGDVSGPLGATTVAKRLGRPWTTIRPAQHRASGMPGGRFILVPGDRALTQPQGAQRRAKSLVARNVPRSARHGSQSWPPAVA